MSAASVNGSSPSHNGGRQSPAEHLTVNGVDDTTANGGNSDPRRSPSSSGFVAVNHHSAPQADGVPTRKEGVAGAPSHEVIEYLEKRFLDVRERKRHKSVHTGTGRHSLPSSRPRQSLDTSQHADHLLHGILSHQSATGPSFNSSANNRPVHNNDGRELIKAKMIAHVEGLNKGDRIDPPCDRCRRLPGMECRKNLTACMGCTRKHARCAWLKVTEDEIVNSRPGSVDEPAATGEAHSSVEAVEDATDSLNDGGTPSPNVDQRENADSVAVDVGAKLEDVEMSTS
ncbi:MAG: hypothetical protein M1825_004590 [Sarcosagium campestre]|nr:MAG: hypothetical protein M1825_004590 [Sarcosagium campestre]